MRARDVRHIHGTTKLAGLELVVEEMKRVLGTMEKMGPSYEFDGDASAIVADINSAFDIVLKTIEAMGVTPATLDIVTALAIGVRPLVKNYPYLRPVLSR